MANGIALFDPLLFRKLGVPVETERVNIVSVPERLSGFNGLLGTMRTCGKIQSSLEEVE